MSTHSRTRNIAWTQDKVKKNAYTKINSCTALQNNSNLMNSNEFTEFDMKKVKILTWKSKNLKKPKNLTFQDF